jgi:RNA polymerase sigma factor FliA
VDIRGVNLSSLDASPPDDEGGNLLKYISGDPENWPSYILESSELQRLVADAIARMPRTERIVIILYYQEELTLREISKVVKLHESRISQLKAQAILRLRDYMEKPGRWKGVRLSGLHSISCRPCALRTRAKHRGSRGGVHVDSIVV